MPLIKSKSKAAVGKNIATEMSHGKSQKQALAIALDVQRRSGGGGKAPAKKAAPKKAVKAAQKKPQSKKGR